MSSRTEAVLLVSSAWGGRGGLQGQIDELAALLVRECRVVVLTWRPMARPRRVRHAAGIDVVTVPSLLPWDRDLPSAAAALNTLVSLVTGALGARLLARGWSVACAFGLQPEATVAVLAAGHRRRVVVRTWLVGRRGNVERVRRSAAAPLVRMALRRPAAFAVETAEAGRELTGLGIAPDRVRLVPLGVDLSRFHPRRDDTAPVAPAVVFAGRLDLRQKRVDLLLEAWRRAALPGWELVIAGDGPDVDKVRALAAPLPAVRLLGWQDPAPLLAAAELFALPTVAETTALAMLEGMASGLPGLVSDLPGIAERAPDGVRLVANEPEAWAAALRATAAAGATARRAAGRGARRWAEAHADGGRLAAGWTDVLRLEPRAGTD